MSRRLLVTGIAALNLILPCASAQVAAHCGQTLSLEALIEDMAGQNLVGETEFWGSNQTKVNLLLANAGQAALASVTRASGNEANQELRELVQAFEAAFDLPIPEGGPLIPSLRPKTADLEVIEQILTQLQVMEPWVDVPFSLSLEPELGLPLDEFRALWAQSRAYARDVEALAYVQENNLIVPRAIRAPTRFRPAIDADFWDGPSLMIAIEAGEMTWVEVENIVWGWMKAGERIRIQILAQEMREKLLLLRQDFVAGVPNFEALEPFSGYFSSWQRWEDLSARMHLLLGQRDDVPTAFFHQTLSLGYGETEPNIAAFDASLLFAQWEASGYQNTSGGLELLTAQRTSQDIRSTQDLYAFYQVLVQGKTLGEARLTAILEDLENNPEARWLGGSLLMDAFFALDLTQEAKRAAEVAAHAETGLAAPFDYVAPLVRVGSIDLAREILDIFHSEACSRVALRSNRTYSWIEWLPLTAAAYWRVPVSRFDGI